MFKDMYEVLSDERKKLQESGDMPEWYSTGGWQLFKERYLYQAKNPREQYKRIADTAAQYVQGKLDHPEGRDWGDAFFNLLWSGTLSASTPILANMGTKRGLPVSCSGQYIGDSIDDIYAARRETAILTKHGFGTAGYFNIRGRGTPISVGGVAEGTLPVFESFVEDMKYVSQGSARRGAFAAYIEIDHTDFYELCAHIEQNPEDANIGWIVSNEFIEKLKQGDEDSIKRYQKSLRTKMVTGKGYYFFKDKANDARPQMYKDLGLFVEAPQLCVAPKTKILTRDGYIPIVDLEDESVDIWNGEEWSEVVVRKTGEDQELISVQVAVYEDGEFIDNKILHCTPYHNWYNESGIELRTFQLTSGDWLLSWDSPSGSLVTSRVVGLDTADNSDTYCFTEHKRGMGVFNGILTGQCNEIMLHSSPEYTYTCVLSSMNLSLYDNWKDTNAVFEATVFLDCVAEDFIQKGSKISGLEKAVAFTKKSRALGLGACGLSTLFQKRGLPFEGFEAHMLNTEIFKYLRLESGRASKYMAEKLGEPEWCEGYGVRNTHLRACAPTKSTALIMGGISEGINPDPAMTYTQTTSAGEVDRVNPVLLELMKSKGVYTKKHIQEIVDAQGSVQGVSWLSDEEKLVFKTAFEIDQNAIIRLASQRQKDIDQGQSLNFFFSSEESEEVISDITQKVFTDVNILGIYYYYSKRGVSSSKGECLACQ